MPRKEPMKPRGTQGGAMACREEPKELWLIQGGAEGGGTREFKRNEESGNQSLVSRPSAKNNRCDGKSQDPDPAFNVVIWVPVGMRNL